MTGATGTFAPCGELSTDLRPVSAAKALVKVGVPERCRSFAARRTTTCARTVSADAR